MHGQTYTFRGLPYATEAPISIALKGQLLVGQICHNFSTAVKVVGSKIGSMPDRLTT